LVTKYKIKFLINNIIEQKLFLRCKRKCNGKKVKSKKFCKRCLSSEKIIDIGEAKFYVPNYPVDYIQRFIVDGRTFFEIGILQKLQSYIKKNSVIFDIGANIGNHSIYWAIKSNTKKVYSFEPVKDTFNILKKNIEINNITEKVKIYNIGLSNEKIKGSISFYNPGNIGGTRIKQDLNGDLSLEKLDNIKIVEDTIDFIKIDVEGHELEVLQGGKVTIKTYKPIIFVESFSKKKMKVHEYLTNLGYKLVKEFPQCNYLYIFADGE